MNDASAYHVFRRDVKKKNSFSFDFGPGIADLQRSTDKVKFVPVFWIPDNRFSTVPGSWVNLRLSNLRKTDRAENNIPLNLLQHI